MHRECHSAICQLSGLAIHSSKRSLCRRQIAHSQSRRTRSAFTLIETIAAIVILSIAIPTMTWAVHNAHYQRINPMMASKARWLATEKLEDIIADRHSTTRGYSYLTSGNYANENPVSGYTGFTRSVTFTTTNADLTTVNSNGGYRRATVTVGWTDGQGIARSLQVNTVVTDY
jgi:prepilin-type N-terminal cleavage/methylation domain-containing protein